MIPRVISFRSARNSFTRRLRCSFTSICKWMPELNSDRSSDRLTGTRRSRTSRNALRISDEIAVI